MVSSIYKLVYVLQPLSLWLTVKSCGAPDGQSGINDPACFCPQRKDHKDDMLCIAQCPPSLLATGSHDGEIIVWNVVSGHTQCRFHSPLPPEYQNVQGELILLKFQQKITRLAKTQGDARLYVADQIGYIYIYNMEEFAFGPEQNALPEMPSPIASHVSLFWSSLQIVDNDQVVLTSSTDCTVRLWSAHGEFIGTFGQSEPWNVYISSSWKHPAVPYEILIDPLSLPVHEILNGNTCVSNAISPDKEAEADGEELKVSNGILLMDFFFFFFFFLHYFTTD
uniref:WD40 repeat domain 95 n=1 Tax=Myripristis murdjan TaxID=586833 RepID=A0A667XLA7_9TELE